MEGDIRHFFGNKIECGVRIDSWGRIRSHTGLEAPVEDVEPSLRAFAETYLSRDECIAAGLVSISWSFSNMYKAANAL